MIYNQFASWRIGFRFFFFLSRIDFEMNRDRKAKVKREQPCGHAASSLKNTIRGGLLTEEGEGVDEFA